ncbi:MAG TPA: maltose alpha-D-glucosyltransferase [Bryobacteraceae bacterium]|jgi:maltose alpha-D-glucosyltransferase/alpha-amylase|nr:maltose alpha-D-glucosyltransferase [Bryobacteraceae bacterium]
MHPSQILSGLEDDPLWYKDAIVYEAHVRAFLDHNGDGMGDFRGLAEKLDYLEDLGVTAIWLLPFFPSPWKDDGYDISDFRNVHPAYGTLRDFQYFLKEAHRRGLRVITELVVNHTSDQHVWFQRSRRAEAGSRWRDFYVWSDNPEKYSGTRIIFKDFEPSNWSWDPVAKAYYWHRFFSHQPDLNFDNPLVRRAVSRTLDFWAEMGVDGFRLDAIPYLYEREGTNCENLPETHDFLKELRAHMDQAYPNRMFLAEANMWPEDAVAYFGKADECHMSFHFPLMPRLFMALRLEDRLPIVEILKRTPPIPETCQWALFLRNHDELTLEMVTDEERDYMYRVYAADQRARINLGIRRRLAPLLGNDRPRIEVMNALLFSLPGTPVIYYGDEIGMGDNVYLGDRNGVRTPMQWSPDRNAGFSRANPQKLYLPVTIDPAYHYEATNVEAQQDNPHSLLSWMKRLIALRKQYKAFGRGSLEFLAPSNQRVLAFFRRYEQEQILVVANLSRFAQPVELDLHKYRGYTPVEMLGRTDFPVIGETNYPITLGPNSFYWFTLEQRSVPLQVTTTAPDGDRLKLPALSIPSLSAMWEENSRANIASVAPKFIVSHNWYQGVGRRVRTSEISEVIPVVPNRFFILLVRLEYGSGDPQTYTVPIGIARGDEAQILKDEHPELFIAELRAADGSRSFLYDATANNEFSSALLEALAKRKRFQGADGALTAQRNRQFRRLWGSSHPNLEPVLEPAAQRDTTIRYGDRFVLKLLRNVEPGVNPGAEIGQLLTETIPFAYVAPYSGSLDYRTNSGETTTVALLHGFVPNDGEAWQLTRTSLNEFYSRLPQTGRAKDLEKAAPPNIFALSFALADPPELAHELIGSYLDSAQLMGKRLAELHLVLARASSDPAFAPEPYNDFYRQGFYHSMLALTSRRFEFVRQRLSDMIPDVRTLAAKTLELEDQVAAQFHELFAQRVSSQRTRYHGRAHLAHWLVSQNDFVLFDFQGDPEMSLSERRIKRCPLRDVASMLHSFGYAAQAAVLRHAIGERNEASTRYNLRISARFWLSHVAAAFLRGYWNAAKGAAYLPRTQPHQQLLLDTHMLERALLDVRTNLNEAPDLVAVPFRVILHLLNVEVERPAGEWPESAKTAL